MPHDQSLPLTLDELYLLEERLAAFPESMNLEMLDGFFAALLCSPDKAAPDDFIPHLLGTETPEFAVPEEAAELRQLLLRQWIAVEQALADGESFRPLFYIPEGGSPAGNEWSQGFVEGMEFNAEQWETFVKDKDNMDMLLPVLVLSTEHSPDPELCSGPISAKDREGLIESICFVVPLLYEYFTTPEQDRPARFVPPRTPSRRQACKVGRNEPCPCGSGKKYKACCGRG